MIKCKTMRVIIVCVIAVTHVLFASQKADFYVSPDGKDIWPGTIEKPFLSLARTRDAVRELKQTKTDDITVLIRGGAYTLKETLVFGLGDGGKDSQMIRYHAYPGEVPVFSSAVKIDGWRKAGDLENLPETAEGNIWVADLPKELGLFYTMYEGETRLPRARGKGFKPTVDAYGRDKKLELRSRTTMYYPEGALIKNWSNLDDIEIVIRPWALWVMNILPLESVDEENRIATTKVPGTYFLTRERYNRFGEESVWVENIIEGMTEPGNWCVNTQQRKIYYWPTSGKPGEIYVPKLKEYIRIEGKIDKDGPVDVPVENLHFKGLTFVHGERDLWTNADAGIQHDWELYDKDNAYLRLRGAKNCIVEGCEFRNGAGGGIRLDLYAQGNIIRDNHVHHLGGTGIFLCGYGLGTKDVNKNNKIINNHIHQIGEIYWLNAGLTLNQSGSNYIAHNLIHDTPYNAISLTGYRPYFIHNEFRKAAKRGTLEGTDYAWCYFYGNTRACGLREIRSIRWDEIGQVYDFTIDKFETGYSPIFNLMIPFLHLRSNIIEYNEIHNAVKVLDDGNGLYISDTGPFNIIRYNYFHTMRSTAIRTDAHQRDTLIHGNIMFRTGGGLACYNNNQAYNNIIALPGKGYDPDGTPYKGGVYYAVDHGGFVDGVVQRNIVYLEGDGKPSLRHYNKDANDMQMQVDYNLIYFRDDPNKGNAVIEESREMGYETHSVCADPLFVDIDNGDFRLTADSPAITKLGFVPIDVSRMGLTADFPEKWRPQSANKTKCPMKGQK